MDAYLSMVEEFGATSILDLGCGTGTFACLLAGRGRDVMAVDPATASLDVARRKPGAEAVHWIHGDATTLPSVWVDLATMTGNVAQVFVEDQDWLAALAGIRHVLRPGGRLVFETRDPARRAWKGWNKEQTYKHVDVPGVGGVETWVDLLHVDLPLVSFLTTFHFEVDGATMTSESTLQFRTREEVVASLSGAGFVAEDMRDAPDRPGSEMVFIAVKAS